MVYYYYSYADICEHKICYMLIAVHEFVLIIANNMQFTDKLPLGWLCETIQKLVSKDVNISFPVRNVASIYFSGVFTCSLPFRLLHTYPQPLLLKVKWNHWISVKALDTDPPDPFRFTGVGGVHYTRSLIWKFLFLAKKVKTWFHCISLESL